MAKRLGSLLLVAVCCHALLCPARADVPPAPVGSPAEEAQVQSVAAALRYRQGEVTLRNGLARIQVPSTFRFLDGADAQTVLTRIWKNPPGPEPLGMLLPAGASPLDPDTWAVIISYDEDGYVKDDEAAKIDYQALLRQMQAQAAKANEERQRQGYPSVELVGWAATPHYDRASHKLYWAKELRFGGDADLTLNYNIRMLGRRGVLVLNAVAPAERLPEIEAATPSILRMVDFQEGHRYTDFNPASDKVATYGLIGLIAGGVLAKAGLFKVLLPAILAFKKVLIVAAVAVISVGKRLWARLTGKPAA